MRTRTRFSALAIGCSVCAFLFAGCATKVAPRAESPAGAAAVGSPLGAAAAASPAGGGTPPAAGAGTRPDSASLKPFREVIAGAREIKGLLPIWQKDDKVWIEVPVERLDQPLFFSYNISDSVGERGAYASQMGERFLVSFHRIGNALQLIAKNTRFIAAAGSPTERAVRQSFSDSLIGSAPVLSQPHPERKSVLVDAAALLINDIPGYSTRMEASFRINYSLDRANSSFVKVHADDRSASFAVRDHFSVARLPGIVVPTNPMPPIPPTTPPDARSVFVGFVYNFVALPEPMKPRYADDRVGFFTTTLADYTSDGAPTPRRHFVDRWRLEKKDPGAALSDPKEPIVYWVDRNVPVAYRDTIIEGILVWNKAFERIGFSNAIVAKIQPDDADFDTLDARHASVRWFLGADAGFAIGPSQTDPRTGEILDADIAIPDVFTRNAKTLITEALPPRAQPLEGALRFGRDRSLLCDFAAEAVDEAAFALGLLDARGEAPADGADADRFARDYLRAVVTHEVGHTLGMRHNFHASTIRSPAQLQDAAYTRANGLTGSVMDYNPFNIAMQGEQQGEYTMSGLGPYDYWAIEYAYRPIDEATPEGERAALSRIAARSTEPDLAFATDEDADAGPDGMDPEVSRFDLGSDPLVYYRKRFALSRELWDRLQIRRMQADESYLVLRRNLERGFNEIARATPLIAKYVGGVKTSRRHVAAPVVDTRKATLVDNGVLYVPVDAARQKQALDLLATQLFAVDSFRFKPDFIGRLGIDYLDRDEPNGGNKAPFYLPGRVIAIQRGALDHLMSEPVARRIADAENMSSRPRDLLTLSQLYATLQRAVWSELSTGQEITRLRRNLQREHLKRVVAVLLRPGSATLSDARSLQRENAIALRASIERALAANRFSPESRAHLRETVATIDDALKASLQRTGA